MEYIQQEFRSDHFWISEDLIDHFCSLHTQGKNIDEHILLHKDTLKETWTRGSKKCDKQWSLPAEIL